jgi:hypothetical protein
MPEQPEKKIIVDEDWKSQIERERSVERERAAGSEGAAKAAPEGGNPPPDMPLPPADLTYLVVTLSLEAFACLGLAPGRSGQPEKNLPLAKHFIDLLEVLQQKTEGNRTDDETRAFDDTLYQLRMAYVQVAQ